MKRTYSAFLLSFALLAGPAAGAPGGGHGHQRADRAQARVERQAVRQHVQKNRAHRQAAVQRHQVRAERHQVHAARHEVRAVRHQVRAERHQARAEHRLAAVNRHQARAERRHAAVIDRQTRHERRANPIARIQRHERANRPFVHQQRIARQERVAAGAERRALVEQGRLARQERRALRADRFVTREQRREVFADRARWVRQERALRQAPAAFPGRMRFRGLDVDRNGVISRFEWRGNDRSFANHDWNGDGILDGNEVVPAGRRVARVERFPFLERFVPLPQRFVAPVPLTVMPLAVEPVAFVPLPPLREALPLPIEEARLETVFRTQGFGPIDLMVNRVSFTPVDRVLITDRFVFLDSNRDRFVGFDEWVGPRPLFRTLDLNRDRFLAPSELVVTRPIVRTVSLVDRDRYVAFALLDQDDDGILAPWEWTGSMDVFFLLDVDVDGVVSQPEYLGLVRTRPVPVRLIAGGALDLDGNGYVSRYEWVGDPYRFVSLDLNGDGRLRPYEAVTGSVFIRI